MRDSRFLATFPAGFERIIPLLLLRTLPKARVLSVSSGMVVFSAQDSGPLLAGNGFFSNVFAVVREWSSSGISFPDMVNSLIKKDSLSGLIIPGLKPGSPFRLRFSRANRFESVDRKFVERAEHYISAVTRMKSNRVSANIEFWFMIRQEGPSYFAVRLAQHASKKQQPLRPGELRPETALLVSALALPDGTERIVLDPFAGYGAIPARLEQLCPKAKVYASDIEASLVTSLQRQFSGNSRITVRSSNACTLSFIDDGSVDLVVTDPPWGNWEGGGYSNSAELENLYAAFLVELDRVLSPTGKAAILTGAKDLFEKTVSLSTAFSPSALCSEFRTDILVNGKKAAVYVLVKY